MGGRIGADCRRPNTKRTNFSNATNEKREQRDDDSSYPCQRMPAYVAAATKPLHDVPSQVDQHTSSYENGANHIVNSYYLSSILRL